MNMFAAGIRQGDRWMKLGGHELRRLAVAAIVDPRTLLRYFDGQPIRSTSATRIRAALRATRTSAHANGSERRRKSMRGI
jgi:hypothetical protein